MIIFEHWTTLLSFQECNNELIIWIFNSLVISKINIVFLNIKPISRILGMTSGCNFAIINSLHFQLSWYNQLNLQLTLFTRIPIFCTELLYFGSRKKKFSTALENTDRYALQWHAPSLTWRSINTSKIFCVTRRHHVLVHVYFTYLIAFVLRSVTFLCLMRIKRSASRQWLYNNGLYLNLVRKIRRQGCGVQTTAECHVRLYFTTVIFFPYTTQPTQETIIYHGHWPFN